MIKQMDSNTQVAMIETLLDANSHVLAVAMNTMRGEELDDIARRQIAITHQLMNALGAKSLVTVDTVLEAMYESLNLSPTPAITKVEAQ